MGHIKVSQIRIHLIENIEKYIGTCITKLFPYVLRKPNPSPIINRPHDRYDESVLRLAIPSLVLFQPVFFLQGFPHMHSFSHVI